LVVTWRKKKKKKKKLKKKNIDRAGEAGPRLRARDCEVTGKGGLGLLGPRG
jgi:hypothetical protein